MNEAPLRDLARRQQQLLARSAALRAGIAADMTHWQPPLALADRVRNLVGQAGRWLRAHPEVPAGLAVLFLVLRPRRATGLIFLGWRLSRRGWQGWRLWQRLRRSGLLPTR